MVKEKKYTEEKERILLNTLDVLKQLENSSKEKSKAVDNNDVIDISGEEDNVGASSRVFECQLCIFKSSTRKGLEQHKRDKHKSKTSTAKSSDNNSELPCDKCDFIATNAGDYIEHEEKHKEERNVKRKGHKDDQMSSDRKKRDSKARLECDMCEYSAKDSSDFIQHIDMHQRDTPAERYKCDLCQYTANSSDDFKNHLRFRHDKIISRNGKQRIPHENNHDNIKKSRKLCIYWNRGHCRYSDENCHYVHEEIPACKYQERCYKHDCKFFHHQQTGKFPFLVMRDFQPRTRINGDRPFPEVSGRRDSYQNLY